MKHSKKNSSTIVAQASGPGESAISIVRLSGTNALKISQLIWQPARSQLVKPRELTLGWLIDDATRLDQAMRVYMPGPHSYTGEDVVEIHLHGAPIITQTTIELALKAGATMARPGEFTERAYLAGKLDLIQAEAVAELISSSNTTMMRLASKQLAGGLSNSIKDIKNTLLGLAAHEAALLDFSEEDITNTDSSVQLKTIHSLITQSKDLLKNHSSLGVVRSGVHVALVGLPNAGKSTLLNTLLGFDRSIVTSTAGTTRDTITETINLDGLSLHLTDTAGLRRATDDIESMGIERTQAEIHSSDCILILIEPGQTQATVDYLQSNSLLENLDNTNSLVVYTKSDVAQETPHSPDLSALPSLSISAQSNTNISALRSQLQEITTKHSSTENLQVITTRQIELITGLNKQLTITTQLLENHTPSDIILVEYQKALQICNYLTGEEVTQEIINEVFSHFCIGK